VVEAKPGTVNEGDVWDGKKFSKPPDEPIPVQPMTAMKFAEELFDVMKAKNLIADDDLSDEAKAFIVERRAKEQP
jgi:hypothetical protein